LHLGRQRRLGSVWAERLEAKRRNAMRTSILLMALLAGSLAQAQEQPTPLPWPAQDAWEGCNQKPASCWDSQYLLKAKSAFIQSDLPASYSTPPTWFSERYTLTQDSKTADMLIFIRPGVGGNTNPDILALEQNGERILSILVKPQTAPTETYDPCHHFPQSQSVACGLSNLSDALNPPSGEVSSNWDQFRGAVNGQVIEAAKQLKKDKKKRGK
jgi:hypothetical protein